jgi:ribose 5-phosphate isomerase B
MTIYIGAGHRGFALKEKLIAYLRQKGDRVVDCGNDHYDAADDYPQFAFAVGECVATDPDARGIVLCGSGVGACRAVSCVPGIRAGLALSTEQIADAVAHDHLQVMCLSADYTTDDDACRLTESFLTAVWDDAVRHVRRIEQIAQYKKTA